MKEAYPKVLNLGVQVDGDREQLRANENQFIVYFPAFIRF